MAGTKPAKRTVSLKQFFLKRKEKKKVDLIGRDFLKVVSFREIVKVGAELSDMCKGEKQNQKQEIGTGTGARPLRTKEHVLAE